MTSQPVEANVVLTADNTAYDQAMIASAGPTNDLGKSIDTLGQKINNLSKSAGRKLLAITAADVALITGATTAWAAYEKQVSRLQAQSAILTKTNDQQTRVMKDYTAAVKGLRTEYGTTTTEAAKLVETLSKVTGLRQSRDLADLSKVFTDMSLATGESSQGLAASLTNLQKVVGEPISKKATRDYADMFTSLSAQTNTTAQGLIDFTAQIAPMGDQMGMSTKQIAGFATAFTRAGQEGFAAGNVFNKITGDITHAVQSGSSEMTHYANLIGITSDQFKGMDAGEQVIRIMERLHELGPQASTELARLGLEGPRSMRAITAVSAEPGGVRGAVQAAEQGYGSGAAAEGAKSALQGLSDEFDRLKESMLQTAEAMASYLGPVVESFVSGMVKVQNVIQDIAEGPMGEFLQMVMSIVAPLAAGAGMLLLFAGALLKIAAAFTLFRSSPVTGFREGLRGGAGLERLPDGSYAPRGGGELGDRGKELARGPSTWWTRGGYNVGQTMGAGAFGGVGAIRERWMSGRERFDPNYQRPLPGTPSRGPLSYLAGGMGRAIDAVVTPQFDQMRYRDITKREASKVFGETPPTVRFREWLAGKSAAAPPDIAKMAGRDPAVMAAEDEVRRTRQVFESQQGVGDPAVQEKFRQQHEEAVRTAEQATDASRTRAQADVDAAEATRKQTGEVKSNTTGFLRLRQSIAGAGAGAAGAVGGGLMAGGRALKDTGMGWPIGGMAAMGVMSATGVESQTAMMGAMGATMGPWGAGIGVLAGAGVDAAKANDNVMNNLAAMGDFIEDGGTQFSAMSDSIQENTEGMNDWFGDLGIGKDAPKLNEPFAKGDFLDLASTKNTIEGFFGDSDVEEAEKKFAEEKANYDNKIAVAKDLAEGYGEVLYGTPEAQLTQLENFMNEHGQAMLAEAGTTYEDLVAARAGTTTIGEFISGGALQQSGRYETEKERVLSEKDATDLESRLIKQGGVGAIIAESPAAKKAIRFQEDVEAFYLATEDIFKTAKEQGMSYLQIMKSAEKAQQEIATEDDRHYELALAVSQKAQEDLSFQAPQIGRAAAFQQQLKIGMGVMSIDTEGMNAEQLGQLQQQKSTTIGAVGDQVMQLRQMLLAQDQYDLSRERAQEDYALQRSLQEYDFNLQRTRAEENFNRMRARATADYHRSVRRAWYDFNLQRERQEEDYNHSIAIQAKQQAMGIYDIYQRVQTERISSAEWLLVNAQDQLDRMQEQSKNLGRLREMGLSTNAIQQLKLNDPANAQQLASFVTDMTPKLIQQFNKTAGSARLKAAKDLVTDPSSLEFQEMARQYRRGRRFAQEDMELSMDRSHQDFKRGLSQQREDFNIVMEQQAEDYDHMVGVQEKQYKKSMDRQAEDFANMSKEILLSVEDVLTQSQKRLTGAAGKQAEQVATSIRKLKNDTRPEAIALMEELTGIYGFDWKPPPKSTGSRPSGGTGRESPGGGRDTTGGPTAAEGAIIPGWTPGRDTTTAQVSGGEAIMRPEWARAMGEENIRRANHQAKYGGFKEGGLFWPVPGHDTGTYAGHTGVDINRGSGSDDYGDPIVAARAGRVDYVGTSRGYGEGIFIKLPNGLMTIYGHTSSQAVSTGDSVRGGQKIGEVGSTGNSTAPHLHFEVQPGGTYEAAMAFLRGAMMNKQFAGMSAGVGAQMGGMTTQAVMEQVLKDDYPKAERTAAAATGLRLLAPGQITKLINRFARKKIKKLQEKYGAPGGDGATGAVPSAPGNVTGNQALVKKAMLDFGWAGQWNELYQLVSHESGFDNNAQNPTSTAYGMFQFLDGTWPGYGIAKTSDPWRQAVAGMRYIKGRYGDPQGAWDFWQNNNWYQDGSVFTKPTNIGIGENGPEAVIPLNARGADYMADVMGSVMGGRNMVQSGRGLTVYNTRVDRSTNFTGAITVQANNPNELLHKLQARQRVMALRRPSLTTGSAA